MSNATTDQESNVLEAAAVLFQVARSASSSFTEAQINNSKSLRKDLVEKILKQAKTLRPDLTEDVWQKASAELVQRQG